MYLRSLLLLISSTAGIARAAPALEPQSFTIQADISLNSNVEPAGAQEPISALRAGRMTYYAPGLGSCGKNNGPEDHIVALSSAIQGAWPPKYCGKSIKISHAGKSLNAKVVDSCPGCGPNDIDVAPSVFKHFSPLSTGVVQVTWDFVGKDLGVEEEEAGEDEYAWMYEKDL